MLKLFIYTVFSLSSVFAYAQVNLDAVIPTGSADMVFHSTTDTNGAYLLPTKLVSLGQPRIEEIDGEYRAFFDVGMDQTQFDPISAIISAKIDANGTPMTLRMMRGWNAKVETSSFEIEDRFKAVLEPLGDPGVLGNPLPYVLTIKKIGPKLGKESQALLKNLFSSEFAHHLGTIRYEFNAVMGGQPYISATRVGVFSVNREPMVQMNQLLNLKERSFRNLFQDAMPALEPKITLDSQSSCWDKPVVGEICLRAQ